MKTADTPRTMIAVLIPLALAFAACDGPAGPGVSDDPREAATPSGERPLVQIEDDDEVADTVAWASMAVDDYRSLGVQKLIAALKKDLAARGVDTDVLDRIDDSHIGKPLPRLIDPGSSEDGVAKKSSALSDQDAQKYFECPLYAPEDNSGTDCAELVQGTLAKVQNDIEQSQGSVDDAVQAEYAEMPGTSREFITAWAQAAQAYGANVAAIYAERELRAANECDDHANAEVVSYVLGIEQGTAIVEELRAWAMEQVKACVINTDQIAERVRQMAKAKVTTFIERHLTCTSADLARNNLALKQSEAKRKSGIEDGIDQRVEILRQELFAERKIVGCCDGGTVNQEPVAPAPDAGSCNIGGSCNLVQSNRQIGWQMVKGNCVCCRRRRATDLLACKGPGSQPIYCGENRDGSMYCQCKSIPLGSPLVIDLDADGLELTKQQVSFDLLATGEPQRSTWVGRREGLLAIDLDGDGKVGSSAELFGNRSDCGDHRCYDGPEAIAQYDRATRGGNGDGLIDDKDPVFDRLRVWVDANGDAVSQPGELQPLSAHGIVAINLEASYEVERRAAGSITSQLELMTEGGALLQAHDVWFRLSLDGGKVLDLLK